MTAPPTATSVPDTRKAGWTVAGIILLNLVLQITVLVIARSNHLETATVVRIVLFSGLGFYGLAAALVLRRAGTLGVRPVVARGNPAAGAAEGFAVGAGFAVLLVALLRLAFGHPVLDPIAGLLASDGAVGPLLVGALVMAVAAPVVEELVFRGFLAEAFRSRGERAAAVISAVAFSLAHLRFAQFRYYLLIGIALGIVYFRRGLVGSVAAHAGFNGMLLVAALAAVHGPPVVMHGGGVTVTVPARWYQVDVEGDDVAAVGPAAARFEITHVDLPVAVDPDETARRLASRGTIENGSQTITVETGTVSVQQLPVGRVVTLRAEVDGHAGEVALLPAGHRMWVATVRTAGSERARTDFHQILTTWQLPPA